MIILFILIGGMVIRCSLNVNPLDSFCKISDFQSFGAFASAGVLELIFELKGLVAVFQRKHENGKDNTDHKED